MSHSTFERFAELAGEVSSFLSRAPIARYFSPFDLTLDSIDRIDAIVALLVPPGVSKGYYALRIDMPDGFRIPPHWHPTDEHVTVISGTFHVAMGDQFDNTKGASLPPGGFAVAPALMHHYAWADGETIVQVDGIGPFKINWVNAADDPKNKKP